MTSIEKLNEERRALQNEVRTRLLGYITAAFGLVAGLAWNEAIGAAIRTYFPSQENSLIAKFVYAILVTLVVVVVTFILSRVLTARKLEEEKR